MPPCFVSLLLSRAQVLNCVFCFLTEGKYIYFSLLTVYMTNPSGQEASSCRSMNWCLSMNFFVLPLNKKLVPLDKLFYSCVFIPLMSHPGLFSPLSDSVSRAKDVLTRVVRLAQRYLVNPMSRQKSEDKGASQRQTKPRQQSPRRVGRSRVSASLTQAQVSLVLPRNVLDYLLFKY